MRPCYHLLMPIARRIVPVLLLLALYYPGITTFFYQDDFGWLNLRHDVHSVSDLAPALFAPKAHGNMRPLGENAYWLGISAVFGPEPLPFHIAAFLTVAAALLLLGDIVRRLTGSDLAAYAAQAVWMVNIGVAPALGWTSIFNQALSAFFFLLAFYFLLERRHTAHWIAFLLGLGALEINIVYPAIAVAYAVLYCPKELRRIAPMFLVSAFAVFLHFHFAPPAAAGPYAPRIDARIFGTFWTYWKWSLGPMPIWLAIALTVAAALLLRRPLAILAAAFFALPLLPYLPLPDHKMDYYLAVPAIGLALLAAAAVHTAPRWAAALGISVYLAASLPAALTITRWQHARGERVEDLVLGVQELAPSRPLLLDGIDTDLFWSGIADLPFRAFSIPHVYLVPGAHIDAPRELLTKYELPSSLAARADVYRFDGHQLHRVANPVFPPEDYPHFVNLADDVFRDFIGPGWTPAPGGYRTLANTATVRIGSGPTLYLGVFDTNPFTLHVTINGIEVPAVPATRTNDLTELRATVPSGARGLLEIHLTASRPLLFGYLEVR